jgi:D-alanine-D-alanine ligase
MKKNIAIIMGGYSSEVAISLTSGSVVHNHLDRTKYNPYSIHILKEKWVYVNETKNEFPIDKNDFSVIVNGIKTTFDCVFNAIHGTPGEDGKILAYFDLIGMKHTSAPFYQMAITFNKRDTLSVVKHYGILTATSIYLNKGDEIDTSKIIDAVGLPCFIKPNNAGSSFGISKAYTADEIITGIGKAYKEDSEILIESFLDGTEVSVGVIQYKGETKVLPITEITTKNDFFDYEAKYEGKSEEITPARISEAAANKVRETAKRVYKILNMSGFSRSEYIFVNDEPHFLEINSVPGLTEESILPQQANEANISLSDLFDNAIETSLNT